VIVVGGAVLAMQPRVAALPEVIRGVLAGEAVADFSTRVRLQLYAAAIEAFQRSPWIGHGWHDMMEAIIPFLDPDAPGYARRLPQLHNDVLDFAVAAGVVGIISYLMLLAAPIVAALRSPPDSQRQMRLYGSSVLVAAYVGAGLTDLMFGFEFHTALYVAVAAIVLGYCRDAAPERDVATTSPAGR
jgi:O-antigen ligase